MSIFENTRKPMGLGGRIMVFLMNIGHRSLAKWGLQYLPLDPAARVLDCGCGGGANIKRLLKMCPQGIVKGVDYSAVSADRARKHNAAAIREGRCVVWQGSVERMIFAAEWFDAVTAFETIYFWPDLAVCFREVYRLLKPGGTFLICNECGGDSEKGEKWAKKIEGMTVYRGIQLHALLAKAGFQHIEAHRNKKGWLCITARK